MWKRAAWRLMRPCASLNFVIGHSVRPSGDSSGWPEESQAMGMDAGFSGEIQNSSAEFPRRATPMPGWIRYLLMDSLFIRFLLINSVAHTGEGGGVPSAATRLWLSP